MKITLTKQSIMDACNLITNDLGYDDIRNETIESNGDYDTINKLETISSFESVADFSDDFFNEIINDELFCLQLSSMAV